MLSQSLRVSTVYMADKRGVSRPANGPTNAGDRCNVDDHTAARGALLHNRLPFYGKTADKFDLKNAPEELAGCIKKWHIFAYASTIDDAPKGAMSSGGNAHDTFDLTLVSHIKVFKQHLLSTGFKLLSRAVEIALLDVSDDHSPPLGYEGLACRQSNG